MSEVTIIKSSKELHNDWNNFANDYFQTKEFLEHCEKFNPCNQLYYQLFQNGKFVAGAVIYSLRVDLLTYLRIKSPIKMNIVGIPASVSAESLIGDKKNKEILKKYISENQQGLLLFLNLKDEVNIKKIASGKTLPTIVIKNNFKSWEEYKSKLRSHYRRRINLLEKNKNINLIETSCNEFTEEMHQQYLQVYNKSNDKLEKLNFAFFKNLPENFKLTLCKKEDQLLGWNISTSYKNKFYFFLGGIDYKFNNQNNTYLLLLVNLLKTGIEQNYDFIDLGQTAETPKLRMGGLIEPRYMQAKHSNYLLNKLFLKFQHIFEYNKKIEQVKVFNS